MRNARESRRATPTALAIVSLTITSLSAASLVTLPLDAAAQNEFITLPLHAADGFAIDCNVSHVCEAVVPTIDVSSFSSFTVYTIVRNYDTLVGVQVAFDWPQSWALAFGTFTCQSNQLLAVSPWAPGSRDGSLVTAFDCIDGGASASLGAMYFLAASTGCLDVIESDYPGGTHVVDVELNAMGIWQQNRGRICVGPGGYDACYPVVPTDDSEVGISAADYWSELVGAIDNDCVTPVEPSSWARIKAYYR